MVSRIVLLGGVVAVALAGCSHAPDYANVSGYPAHGGSVQAFDTTVIAAEGGHESTRTPTPVAWDTTVSPMVVQEIKGPRAVAEEDGPYLLDTGDKLRIFVYGQPSLSRIYTVDHAGQISIPLIGHVHARGTTTRSLEGSIKSRLGVQYVKDPHVTVDISQNRPFFILGEVRQAGQYPYLSGMTVQQAIAIAGGFSERANERTVQITRRINGFIEKLDVPTDYVLLPGDTVNISERWF
jgi:polysaccharide biosynthesis/export protein